MHKIQQELLNLSKHQDLGVMSLRQIAKLVGVGNKPQIVKHHLLQLEKAGLIQLNTEKGVIRLVNKGFNLVSDAKRMFYSLPIVGMANCGPATIFADQRTEGYLKVSSKMLPRKKLDLYVLIADGPSMNKAVVRDNLTIEDGDFVIVDSSHKTARNNDIVVAVIDGMATIKRYKSDKENHRIVLEAESTEKFHPIFIHDGDDFVVSGKVVDVIKKATV
jgi:repressor LexA